MDLNELFARHQVALIKAEQAEGHRERQALTACAGRYVGLIKAARAEAGAPTQHFA
jgi:hypothetical protein